MYDYLFNEPTCKVNPCVLQNKRLLLDSSNGILLIKFHIYGYASKHHNPIGHKSMRYEDATSQNIFIYYVSDAILILHI